MLDILEMATIKSIKSRVMKKQYVSPAEKQLVLDLLKREQLAVRAEVVQRAANSGFNVEGIKTL